MQGLIKFLFLVSAVAQERVFLSQYLQDPEAGQDALLVEGIGQYPSYNGFITIDAKKDSNTFFWFFPAQNGDPDAPVVMWLQGGPGGSSMFGLFGENGPFSVSADGTTVVPREWTWNANYAMLYVDNPVGVGFSYTGHKSGFVTNMKDVGRDLYSALTQFFTVFYQYQDNDFYVSGESYGGKYTPAICHYIHEQNQKNPQVPINLVGMSIGDGLQDPISQFTGFGDLLYYFGMADEHEKHIIDTVYETPFVEYIGEGKLVEAFHVFDAFMNGDFYPYPTYFFNITGTNEYFNFLDPIYPPNPYPQYLNSSAVRALIHVGDQAFWDYNASVEEHLIGDWMRSYREWIPTLLNNYKVMYYNGQNDLILGPPLAEKYYYSLEWDGTKDYHAAEKIVWTVDTAIAGYVRQARNMTQVVVRDAGHLLPADQPEWAFKMISHFIDNTPWVN